MPKRDRRSQSTISKAQSWAYRSSAPSAWSNLAAGYATAEPLDLERARHWYRRAALKGHDRGLFEDGLMLIQGGISSALRRWVRSTR